MADYCFLAGCLAVVITIFLISPQQDIKTRMRTYAGGLRDLLKLTFYRNKMFLDFNILKIVYCICPGMYDKSMTI